MVVAQLADPVLSVERIDLVKRVGVVIEAEVVGGEAVQSLINEASAGVQHGLVIQHVRNTEARLKVCPIGRVKILLRIFRGIEQHVAAGSPLAEPGRRRQTGQPGNSGSDIRPAPSTVGGQHILGVDVVLQLPCG